jgi:hypothetical protein
LYNFDNQVRTESNLVVNTTTPSDLAVWPSPAVSYFADNVFFGDSIGIAVQPLGYLSIGGQWLTRCLMVIFLIWAMPPLASGC